MWTSHVLMWREVLAYLAERPYVCDFDATVLELEQMLDERVGIA